MNSRFAIGGCALALLALTSACGGTAAEGGQSTDGPLRIAVITPLSGPSAAVGEETLKGAELTVEMLNADGGVNGQDVELVKLETDQSPNQTLQRVDEALTSEQAPFVTGFVTSAEVLAVMQRVESRNGVLITTTTKSDDVLQHCSTRTFSFNAPSSQSVEAVATSIDDWGGESWSIIAGESTLGHNAADQFTAAAEAAGKEVNDPIFVPLGTNEFGSQISKLQNQDADNLFVQVTTADAVGFATQSDQFGLFEQYGAVVGQNFVIDPLFDAMGPSVVGTYSNIDYAWSLDTPANKEYIDAWHAKYGDDDNPSFIGANLSLGIESLAAAAEAAGSVDPEAVAEALSELKLDDSIVGPAEMRADDGLLLRPEYVGEVVTSGDSIDWKVTDTVTSADSAPAVDCSLK